MADRRRRPHSEGESDEESTETGSSQSPRKPRQSECESEGDVKETEVSDYESANEDNGEKEGGGEEKEGEEEEGEEEEEEEEDDEEEEESEEEEDDDDDEEYEDEDVIIEDYDEVGEERQSGDGEEQPDNQKLDDDEDRKNPAFIPRQGAFYEHDLRLGEDGLEEDEKRPRKKLWQDEGRWSHDKYSDKMQAPKSREELITEYGHDIRLSDKPPDAPPRRGGGPRRPRLGDKPQFSDFIQESTRDDSYIVEKKNEFNRNSDRYFRGKSEEFNKRSEDQDPTSFNSQNHENERHQPEKYDQWNSRFEENQSYRNRNQDSNRGYDRNRDSNRRYSRGRDSDRGYSRDSGRDSDRDYGRDSNHGYNRNQDANRRHDRNPDSNRGYNRNQDYDHGYDRNQDNNRSYEKSSYREYENRSPRYDNRNYRESSRNEYSSSSNYDYQRGGRFNNRGYRNDPPRREYTYSRDRGQRYSGGGSGRSRPERARGGTPRRPYETERKIPPRFQKKKEARLHNNYNTENYIESEQMQNYYNDTVSDDTNFQEGEVTVQSHVKSEVFTPSNLQEDAQKHETVEEKGDDKHENVIVQSSTGERKSYSKERRVRTVGKTRGQDSALNAVQEGMSNLQVESEAQNSTNMASVSDRGEQKGKQPSQGHTEKYQSSKQDTGRTKRYSSQRQRNPEQTPPENAQFFPPEIPKGYTKKEIGNPQFPQAILRPPMNFPIPVSTSALPNPPPQRLFRPPPASMTGAVPIIPPQFINTGVIYGAPPAPAPYPVAPIQAFPSPPTVSTAPPPPIPAVTSPNQLQEVYRHGTTYYPPELQYPQIKKRSPAKRTKAAIPIVNPEEVPGKVYDEDIEGDSVDDKDVVDDRDTKLQETIDREYGFDDESETPPFYEEQQPLDKLGISDNNLPPGDTEEGKHLEIGEKEDSEIDSLSTNVKSLTTDISNYTIAFPIEQEVLGKGDNAEDTSQERHSPVSEDKNVILLEKSSPVLEDKDVSVQDLEVSSSSQEVTVS